MTKQDLLIRSRHACYHVVISVAVVLTFAFLPREVVAQATKITDIKIGIIGSGNIGGTVGALWVQSGHSVLFSSRNPPNLKKLVGDLGPRARAGTVREALNFGDVVLVAVPYGAYPQLGKDYAREIAGKIVMDAGNAVLSRDGEIAKEARETGIGLTSTKYLAGARVVRAFNTLNYRRLANGANRAEGRIAIPLAGDDKEALKAASSLVRSAGFDAVIVGALKDAMLFAQGGPLYGQEITAQEMQQRLKSLK